MSFNKKNITEFEKVYSLLSYNTSALTAASTTATIFTSDANKGYCMVLGTAIYIRSVTAGTPTSTFAPRIGVVGGLANIGTALSYTAVADKYYMNNLVHPHTIAPSTAVVLSNSNASVARWNGIIDVFLRVVYFGI